MAAKFLRSMSDDNADFQRQMGCIAGIFQLFDRQNMLTGGRRLIGHTSKRIIPSGSCSSHSSQTKSENHSTRNVQRASSMDMSRASVSSSSHSSSISSLDNTRTPQSDSASFDRMIFPDNPSDIRDLVKDSIYREQQQLQGLKSDASTVSDRYEARRGNEARIPSVVAKLMGLEMLPDSATGSLEETDSRKKPAPGSAMRFPVEPAPWSCSLKNSSSRGGRSHHRAALFPSVYNEIEERFEGLEFMQSGKDLRALKQILVRSKGGVSASQSNHHEPSNVVVLKPVKRFEKKHATATPVVSAKSAKDGKKKKKKKKKVDTERRSLPPTHPAVSGKSRRFSSKQRNSQMRNSSFSQVEDNGGIPEKESGMAWSEEESAESGFVPREYSSPVSVLDNGSPVDFDRKKMESIEILVQKLRRVNSSHDEARIDYIASLCENSNPDHRYISEIMLASGLLLTPSVRDFDFHPSGHPINPELFHVLEQTKGGTAAPRGHRKLVFDAANEILAGRMPAKCGRGATGQMVLRDVCSEIEKLLRGGGGIPKRDDEGGERRRWQWKSAVSDDVMGTSVRWIDPESGISGPVLDIERMIFKDLVNEIVIGESAAKIGRRKVVGAAK